MVVTQRDTLRAYLAFLSQKPIWSGKFLLIEGTKDFGGAAAVAATVAGAAVLLIEENSSEAKRLLQGGYCNFLVTTLDEAIRILKNELRKRSPIVVVLQADPSAINQEMAERGVVPDMLWNAALLTVIDESLLQSDIAATFAERRDRDAQLALSKDKAMQQWIRTAANIFPRELERWYPRL